MNTIGLTGKNKAKSKQKKVEGVVYKVRNQYYFNNHNGFIMYKDGIKVKFHNGYNFNNPYSLDEALEWAIKNL